MSTATLATEARRNVALFSAAPAAGTFQKLWRTDHATGKQILGLKGVPVFRSGTFRDSMGTQHTWEDLHMDQMVDNFDHLIKSGVMPGVPVRKGHSGFFDSGSAIMDGLIGWHKGISVEKRRNNVDGQSYSYLLADYDILDEDAQKKIDSGLWFSLSSEVGGWLSNDEAEYWPVYQGVAYVDFPAVEGLTKFGSANGVGTRFSIMVNDNKENDVTAPLPGQQTVPAVPPVAPAAATPAGQGGSVVQHGAQAPAFEFTLANGGKTTDFSAVQNELNVLGAYKKESLEAARTDFVSGLVTANRLLAPNQEATLAFAKSLDDAQFAAWKATWDNAPVIPVLAAGQGTQSTTNHSGTTPAGGQQVSAADDELSIAEATFSMLQITMSQDQLKATPSYAKLKAAGKAPF